MNIAIIPAKEYSSGLPNKNMRKFAGESLVRHAVYAANIDAIDMIFVSTDSTAIIQEAFLTGLPQVSILSRPSALTMPSVQVDEVVLFSLREIEYIHGENSVVNVIVLQPTSPLRNAMHVEAAYATFIAQDEWPLFSGFYSDKYHYVVDYNTAQPIMHDPLNRVGRQYYRENQMFVENGAIYIAKASHIKKAKTFRAEHMHVYEMSKEASIEIDTQADWDLAEEYLKRYENEDNS